MLVKTPRGARRSTGLAPGISIASGGLLRRQQLAPRMDDTEPESDTELWYDAVATEHPATAAFAGVESPFDHVLGFLIVPLCSARACHRAACASRAFRAVFHAPALWLAHAAAECRVAGRVPAPGALRHGGVARGVGRAAA